MATLRDKIWGGLNLRHSHRWDVGKQMETVVSWTRGCGNTFHDFTRIHGRLICVLTQGNVWISGRYIMCIYIYICTWYSIIFYIVLVDPILFMYHGFPSVVLGRCVQSQSQTWLLRHIVSLKLLLPLDRLFSQCERNMMIYPELFSVHWWFGFPQDCFDVEVEGQESVPVKPHFWLMLADDVFFGFQPEGNCGHSTRWCL